MSGRSHSPIFPPALMGWHTVSTLTTATLKSGRSLTPRTGRHWLLMQGPKIGIGSGIAPRTHCNRGTKSRTMKTANWMMMLLLAGGLAGALALTGCGKKETPTPAPMGVTVDMPKLQQSFANTTPDLQAAVSEVAMGMRYGEYPRSFAALD